MDCLMLDAADFILDSHKSPEDQRLFYERTSSIAASHCGLEAYSTESAFSKMRRSIIRSVNERYCNRKRISPTITSTKKGKILYEEPKEDFVVIRQKTIEVTYFTSNKPDEMTKSWLPNSCERHSWNSSSHDSNIKDPSKFLTNDDQNKSVNNISKVVDIFSSSVTKNESRMTPQSHKNITSDTKKYIGLDENSFKLAQRSHQSIFENCSTYSIPDIQRNILSSDITLSKKSENVNSAKMSTEHDETDSSSDLIHSEPDLYAHSIPKCKMHSDRVDDQVSLVDSFFACHINGDYIEPTTAKNHNNFSNETESSDELQTKSYEDRRESFPPVSETFSNNVAANNLRSRSSHKRRNKKSRKRNRKKKTKGHPTYECSTCGVSYIISSKKLEVNNRCFHCDFWISVEPEFLKVEKHSWNTCSIS